jgi:hypothetical protein
MQKCLLHILIYSGWERNFHVKRNYFNFPLLVDIFSYTYEADFMQKLLKDKIILQNLKSLISLSGILVIICQFIPKLYQLNSINIAKQIFLCLLSWPLPQIWHRWSTFYQTLWQKKRLKFSHYKFFTPW